MIGLLIIQGTPFCNINCSYCYLPDRDVKASARIELFDQIAERLYQEHLVGSRLKILWHAGEPLMYPLERYEYCIATFKRRFPGSLLEFHIQTNGTLITPQWCEFFLKHSVTVGVSLDGPASLHDRVRLTRGGKGTHKATLRGVQLLQQHGLDVHVLAVLTRESLKQPDALFDYFSTLDVASISFNIEEIDGLNRATSVALSGVEPLAQAFFLRYFSRIAAEPGRQWLREYEHLLPRLFGDGDTEAAEVVPFSILTVDHTGNYYTFSPELVGIKTAAHPSGFALGSVYDTQLPIRHATTRLPELFAGVEAGARKCKQECSYFQVCGGGFTSNKLAENGTFDSTETRQCRLSVKVQADALLEVLRRRVINDAVEG